MIVASYVVHNEEALIAESVRSVKAYVDRYVFVDAVFTTNPVEATYSTDRTRQEAERAAHPLPVTYIESGTKLELAEARNIALRESDGDWTLIIDGDETLLGARHEVDALMAQARSGELTEPQWVSVYSGVLVFQGHAPAISEAAYHDLPVIHTRGRQPRLLRAKGIEWRLVPNGKSYGLYEGDVLIQGDLTDAFSLINHRTRQTYAAYQNDYSWETA